MNRFREHGFIDYKDRIYVHRSLLNVILHDQLPDDHTEEPPMAALPAGPKKPVKEYLAASERN
jgi:hypothetical protein